VVSKRTVLLGVAGLLSVSALFAIAILLFGHFGRTEGRILETTGVLAAYGVLALPAAILLDQGRARSLAVGLAAIGSVAASLTVVATWWGDLPAGIGRSAVTAAALTLAATQVASLTARKHESDPISVRRFFASSTVLALVVAGMITFLVWARTDSSMFGRVLGAVVVLDLLTVALQPIFARARRAEPVHRLLVTLAGGDVVAMDIDAPDLAGAAAKAIRSLERDGHDIAVIRVDGDTPPE